MAEAARELLPGPDLVPIDLLGHGGNSGREFSLDAAAEEVLRVAHAHGAAGGLHLVGSGLGALVALRIEARNPADVASLVLAGWPPAEPTPGERRADVVAGAVAENGARAFAEQYLEGLGTIDDGREALVDAIVKSSAHGLIPAIDAAEAWQPPSQADGFPRCLIIRGAQDVRVTEQAARRFADLVGGSYLDLPDAGHLAYIDRPRSFAAAVAGFHRAPNPSDQAVTGPIVAPHDDP